MDGQNFNNEQNVNVEQPTQQNNYYQDYTATPVTAPQPEANQTNGLAVVSLVMGILSIVFTCCYGIGIIFGIIGIICAIVGKKKGKSGVLTAGLICSIIGTILSVLAIIYYIVVLAAFFANPEMLEMMEMMEYYGY